MNKKDNKLFLIIGVVILAVVAIGGLYLYQSNSTSGTSDNTAMSDDNSSTGSSDTSSATTTMTSAKGDTQTLTLKPLPNSRGYIYCELVFDYGAAGQDIYSTSPLAPCDTDWWDSLDLDEVASELGATAAYKNGPQYWAADETDVMAAEPTTVAGVQMNFGAVLPPGTFGGNTGSKTPLYAVFNTAKNQNLTYDAGQPSYQLIDGNGYHYVLQGNKVPTDQLADLGSQFKELPEGWSYQVINPDSNLVIDLSPRGNIPSVQDEFDQIYIIVPQDSLNTSSK